MIWLWEWCWQNRPEEKIRFDRTTVKVIGWLLVAMMTLSALAQGPSELKPANGVVFGLGLGLVVVGYIRTAKPWQQLRENMLPVYICTLAVISGVGHMLQVLP